jgi:hypothetical protein
MQYDQIVINTRQLRKESIDILRHDEIFVQNAPALELNEVNKKSLTKYLKNQLHLSTQSFLLIKKVIQKILK